MYVQTKGGHGPGNEPIELEISNNLRSYRFSRIPRASRRYLIVLLRVWGLNIAAYTAQLG